MSESPFSPDAMKAQLAKLPELPVEEAHAGVVVKAGDIGIEASGSKYLGKGWSAASSFEWMKKKGWQVVAGIGWTGGAK